MCEPASLSHPEEFILQRALIVTGGQGPVLSMQGELRHFATASARAASSSAAIDQPGPAMAKHWLRKVPTTVQSDRAWSASPFAVRHAASAVCRASSSVALPTAGAVAV